MLDDRGRVIQPILFRRPASVIKGLDFQQEYRHASARGGQQEIGENPRLRHEHVDAGEDRAAPLGGLAEAFFSEIQPLLEAPWAVAMNDLVYPQTRGERPPDFETRMQYARALMRLAAEDAETDRLVFEVRSLLRPQSALRQPGLVSRVMSMMAAA